MNVIKKPRGSILFADDSLLMHEIINTSFEGKNYQIIHAYNGDEAFELYTKYDCSMIITDIEMPGLNGLELCKKIKESNKDRFIPVIIISSNDSPLSIETAFEYGADDYIVKNSEMGSFPRFVEEYYQNMERKIKNRILVVDDDKLIKEIIRHAYIKNGFTVFTASNGREALEIIDDIMPDIVVTDIMMPIMDGYKLCENIRGQKKYDSIEIIVTSTRDNPYDIKKAEKYSIGGYFSKPFDVNKLIIVTERLLVEKAYIYKKESEFMLSSIKALVRALEARDPYTNGHSVRVTNYALAIAKTLKVNEQERQIIEIAASLHDIGKIGVKDSVLLKAEKLTDEEYLQIKEHTNIGVDILKEIPSLGEVIPLVYNHHEFWDGQGYPTKISGQDIPLGARIISVADAFDAMTSARPYRTAMTYESAMEIIKKEAGKQFCSVCVEGLMDAIDKKLINVSELSRFNS